MELTAEQVMYQQNDVSPNYAEITTDNQARYTTYYFAENGDDNNVGTSESSPFCSIAKANEIIATAGDKPTKIAFKAGDAFLCEYVSGDAYNKGQLYIYGHSAKEETPLLVTTYGETDTEKYAKLYQDSAAASRGSEIVHIGDSNTRVSNLELTGQQSKLGAKIYSAWGEDTLKGGAMKNVVLSNCWIHDIGMNYSNNANEAIVAAYDEALEKKAQGVFDYMPDPETDFNDNGSALDDLRSIVSDSGLNYSTGAIVAGTSTALVNGPTWLENVWIENNTIDRVARCGMFLSAGWTRRPGWDNGTGKYYYDETTGEEKGYYPNKNFVVRNNVMDYTGGDGIVLLNAKDSYVENNISYHAQYLGRASSTSTQAGYSAGIWIHSCNNVIMQYNEAAYCFKRNGCGDGEGFDIDIGNRNITFRYNYAHHNEGGALLIINRSTSDSVYDSEGNQVTEDSWYDMNGNLVEADDGANKGLPVTEKRYILLENIYVQNNVFAYNDVHTFRIAGPTKNIQICNNTVLLDGKARPKGSEYYLLKSEDYGNTGVRAKDWLFANNIFYQLETQTVIMDETFCDACTISNNVFYNFQDSFFDYSVTSMHLTSTKLVKVNRENPTLATTDAGNGLLNAYKLTASASYLSDFGCYVEKMQALDMNGEDASAKKYVGAFLND